jgi:hypothetical protein
MNSKVASGGEIFRPVDLNFKGDCIMNLVIQFLFLNVMI